MKKDLLIILLLTLPAFAPLIQKGYFTMHDDLQTMRQLQMDNCFRDGQIPCRWVLDMGYGYGYPLFNYYPPFPYLVGQIFRSAFYLPYIDVVKTVGILGFSLTAVFMYLLGREFWGRSGGIISSVFYTYAPYHSVDYYVRGAINEFWAMAFYPAILWTSFRLIKETSPSLKLREGLGVSYRFIPWLSLSVAGLMLSHNPMLMIFFPVAVAWVLFWWWKFKSIRSFKYLFSSALLALGLASFFTFPVLFESKFAHLDTLVIGYFNYLAHYLDIKQIFLNINWGYGSSQLGPTDTMSFALGYLHWIIPIVVMSSALFIKKIRQHFLLLLLLLLFTLGSLFLTHSKSTPVWLVIKPLEFLQFPWRFLTVAVLSVSLLSGAVSRLLPKITPFLLVTVLLLNVDYFHPDKWFPDMTDENKFSGKSWHLLVTSGIFDYLPIYAPMPPADPAGSDINITGGEGSYTRLTKRTNIQKYDINISTPEAVAELQTYYFPGWKIWVDGVERPIDPSRDQLLGRMQVDLTFGRHELLARFTNTPIRTAGNVISLISCFFLVAIMIVWKRSRESGILTSLPSKPDL